MDPLVTLARRSCDECKGAAISKKVTTGGIAEAEMRPCKRDNQSNVVRNDARAQHRGGRARTATKTESS